MSSYAVLSSHLTTLMKDVSEALKFDRQDKNEDAYKKYLECVLRVSTGLLKALYADEGHLFVTKDVVKMAKLGQQCMERVASIVNGRLDEKSPVSKVQAPTNLSLSSGSHRSLSQTTPTTPGSREVTPVTPNRPFSTSDRSPTVPNVITTDSYASSTKKLGPMEMAIRNNQYLLIDLRKRQARTKNKSASTNLSLTLQRRMAENLAIARAQEEALAKKMKERQQRLEEQAQRRFHTPVGLSEEEQQQRQVYKKALEFEQENLWMMELRRKFEETPSDLYVISELVTAILSCEFHPLSIELHQYQKTVLDRLIPLVEKKINTVENITVPLAKGIYEQSNLKDFMTSFPRAKSNTKLSQSESVLESVEEVDSTCGSCTAHDISDETSIRDKDKVKDEKSDGNSAMFKAITDDESVKGEDTMLKQTRDFRTKDLADISAEIKTDVENAIIHGAKLKMKLEEENQRMKMFSRQATEDYEKYNQENMDDLFEDDSDMEDDVDDYSGGNDDSGPNVLDIESEPNDTGSENVKRPIVAEKAECKESKPPKGLKKNPSFENLDDTIALLKNEAYHRHLKGITEDVLTSVERLQVLFVIVFEQLDTADGRDHCNVLLERYFFRPIWKYLLVLFRLANEPKEIALAFIMTENQLCIPQTFAVREKLCLGALDGNEDLPYQSAVTELIGVIKCTTMLEKLDCLVRSSKEVMHCVEQYYKERDTEAPSLGADDLLPVLCYIVVKSSLPQLVSECQAMEKFLHEGYMFGEEGYCLTSFQTAINYLISESMDKQKT